MPMLRPPELVSPEDVGEIVGIKANGMAKVRFRRGVFLVPIDRLVMN